MGWICRRCGTENPYSVNRCPVCEHGRDPGLRLNRERRLEAMDQMLYRLPLRSVHVLHVNRFLALTLAVLLILQGVSVVRNRNTLPAGEQGLPAILTRMSHRLTTYGRTAGARISTAGQRIAVQFSQTVDRIQERAGTLQSSAAGGQWAERAGKLSAVVNRLQKRVQVKSPPLAQEWKNFCANFSLEALWQSFKGILSIP